METILTPRQPQFFLDIDTQEAQLFDGTPFDPIPNDLQFRKVFTADARSIPYPDNSIDLTITSPPYDNLRDYKGYTFNFEGIERVNFLFNYPFFYSFIKQGSDTS